MKSVVGERSSKMLSWERSGGGATQESEVCVVFVTAGGWLIK